MATGTPVGTIFAELDLDASRFTKAQQRILNDAKVVTLGVEQNYKNLGIKSSAAFDLMRAQAINAFEGIRHSANATANDIIRAEKAKNEKLKALYNEQYGTHISFANKMKSSWNEIAAAAATAYAAFYTGKEIINAALSMERINISMQAVTNDANLAGKEIQFIREESERLGLSFQDSAQEYIKFAAAAKNTSIEGEKSRQIFTGMSEAITALKLSTQDASLIYMAMTQMVSKGKVSMEELRRQMGERLPGAIRLAAEGMGMTTAELIKQVEAGNVMAYDLLPALADQLHKTYGQAAMEAAESGQASINRFNNAVFETKTAVGDALMPVLTDVLNLMKSGMPIVKEFIGGLKMVTVDVAASIDKIIASEKNKFQNIGTYLFGTPEEIKKVRDQLTPVISDIERIAHEVNVGIYKQMNHGQSSTKTASELAIEASKVAEVRKKEAAAKITATKNEAKLSEAEKQAIKDIEAMTREIEKEEQARLSHIESINSEIISLSAEANTFGMTKREVALYQLAIKGATTEQYNMADSILKNIEENEKLKTILDALDTPYDQMTKKIMLASEMYQKGAITLEQYVKYTDILAEETKKSNDKAEDSFKGLKDAIEGWGKDSAKAIVDFCMTGKSSFKNMVDSMISDMARMIVQQNITQPLATNVNNWVSKLTGGQGFSWGGLASAGSSIWNWLTGSSSSLSSSSLSGLWDTVSSGIGSAWDWVTSLFHSGGVVGYSIVPTRSVSPLLFANAPRLHDGLLPDEYPAILQRGETVLPSGMNINGIIYPFYDAADYFSNTVSEVSQSIATAGQAAATAMNQGSSSLSQTFSDIGRSLQNIGTLASLYGGFTGNAPVGMVGMGLKGLGALSNAIAWGIDFFGGGSSYSSVSEEQALFGEEGWAQDFSNLAEIMAEMAESGEDFATAIEKATSSLTNIGASWGINLGQTYSDLGQTYSDIVNAYYGGNAAGAAAMAASLGLDIGSLLASNAFGGASYANEYAPGGLFSAEAQAAAAAAANAGTMYGGDYGYETNFHTGGRVGTFPPWKRINPAIYSGAPRLHNGLKWDEYPAILQMGEEVIRKDATTNKTKQFNLILDGKVISTFVVNDDDTITGIAAKTAEYKRRGYIG